MAALAESAFSSTRPCLPTQGLGFAGEPQLTDNAVPYVAVPADDMSLYHCCAAAKDISYWRSNFTAAGAARSLDDLDELQLLAPEVRALLISETAEAGFHREAQRLALQGAAGFPDKNNVALIDDARR